MPAPSTVPATDEEDGHGSSSQCCAPLSALTHPVDVGEMRDRGMLQNAFCLPPLFGPLLFDNEQSDCRDHAANERTFLSYLRLSIYMSIVAVAIVLSFHLRKTASDIELRMAKPLGVVFWVLSVSCLGVGIANYTKTVNKYSRRAALVQSGWKTQAVMGMIAMCIFGSCVVLLVINKLNQRADA
ncbi:47abdef7-17ae-4506-b651-c28c5008b829 [Thermothielavioides terrestris]|uniref:DUF202 domain-containing protein n=2 Tax=Thermothielavioides terrestris TaxID=2587410 RepID=G2R3X8_THETT|nr:uncharacterized protein THITE_2144318 [Thermothielavioides terrestris NRRL 8126]AEO66830.1 hypothetical protein THITE_2144318 [Thermothielavioides terrestris NRRL 8126]SPQ19946.1 47abdef7-17ae-4506-b651-c28c5008b829 [Thermothielavioides terrestris]